MQADNITFTRDLHGVVWAELKAALQADHFDNGRTPAQYERSFRNSDLVCFAWQDGQIVGKARALSDGVCNCYLVDVWTKRSLRNQGIARQIIAQIVADCPGQHIYLQADTEVEGFWKRLGFAEQPAGMFRVIGTWLDNQDDQRDDQDEMGVSQAQG